MPRPHAGLPRSALLRSPSRSIPRRGAGSGIRSAPPQPTKPRTCRGKTTEGVMNRRRFLAGAAGLLTAPILCASATPAASGPFRLRLLDAHTGGTVDGVYRDTDGPITEVMDQLCQFLRDQHSGRT